MNNLKNIPIDFVITWVDQNDPAWQKKMLKYSNLNSDSETAIRFRDYGTLKFVFRSIEKFAPWVNHVFLITDNQIPDWLSTVNNKVTVVSHSEFIDEQFLPTFNSNVIDLSLYKIPNLSEHFVYFNDDMFLNGPVSPTDFFSSDGLPCDSLALNTIMPTGIFDHIYTNNISLINNEFPKNTTDKKVFGKLYNIKNMEWNLLNLLQFPLPRYSRFFDPHIPLSFLKSSIQHVLEAHPEIMKETGKNKFRGTTDYSIWVVRYFQMLSGKFQPRNIHFGKHYPLTAMSSINKDIKFSRHKLINVNDADGMTAEEFESSIKKLESAFGIKLKQTSSFER